MLSRTLDSSDGTNSQLSTSFLKNFSTSVHRTKLGGQIRCNETTRIRAFEKASHEIPSLAMHSRQTVNRGATRRRELIRWKDKTCRTGVNDERSGNKLSSPSNRSDSFQTVYPTVQTTALSIPINADCLISLFIFLLLPHYLLHFVGILVTMILLSR